MATVQRSNSHKANEQSELKVLIESAKKAYTKQMEKSITESGHGNIDTARLKEFHEVAIQSTVELMCDARQLKTKQKDQVKLALDQILVNYFHVTKQQPQKFSIGVYLNSQAVTIGCYTQSDSQRAESTGTFNEVLSVSPEICFSERGIFIGQQANDLRDNIDYCHVRSYFNILELIGSASRKSLHTFHIKNRNFTFCTHEIIAAFFQKLLAYVSTTLESNGNGSNVVVTIPFPPFSLLTERITTAFRILGFSKIRILSTLVTTAIACMEKIEYRKILNVNEKLDSNPTTVGTYLIVIDLQRESVTFGIVLVRPHWVYVVTSASTDSEIAASGNKEDEEIFLQYHKRLYEGVEIPPERSEVVANIYSKTIKRLFSNSRALKKQVFDVIVGKTKADTKPDLILNIIFGILRLNAHVTHASLDKSQLMGASLLASSTSNNSANAVSGILPKDIEVDDCTKFIHFLTIDIEGIERKEVIRPWKPLTFVIPFAKLLVGPYNCALQLQQKQGDIVEGSGATLEVCRYQLQMECILDFNQNVPVDLPSKFQCGVTYEVDADGVYTLLATKSPDVPVKLILHRESMENCNYDCQRDESTAFEKLVGFLDTPSTSKTA